MIRCLVIARMVWLELLRRKDLYVLLILLGGLLLALLSLNVFGLGGMVRYVKDAGLLLAWLFSWILAISVASRQLPQEETRRTIYALLAKPLTRGELLFGKWLGAWSVVCAATSLFYLLIALVVAARGGRFEPLTLAQTGLLHALSLGLLTALALALSTRVTQGAAAALAYVGALASYLIVPQVPVFLAAETGLRANGLLLLYYALPHLELFDLRQRAVHDWGPVPGALIAGLVLYGLAWIALLLLLGWLGFRRKRFNRGAAR